MQIEDVKETGFAVEPGFSGTPVWDSQVEAVVGMIVAAEKRMNLKTAFAIPVDVLAGSWPLLESHVHPFVFLCYARADSERVIALKTDLQGQDISVWIDREGLQPGTLDWEEALRTAIRAARAVLLIASPNARSSRYVRDELRIAELYQRPVYPLWIAGTHWMDAVPLGWGGAQYIDARENRYETAMPELVGLLNTATSTAASVSEPDFEPRNPYKGLRAFNSDDASDFFGRDTLINELATALEGALAAEEKGQQCARLLTVIGPSGCGKSTLFTIVAGIEQPSTGVVAIDGTADAVRAGKAGYMPQQPLLLPWRTVEENVMLGLDVRRVPRQKAQVEAHELLKRFGLADFAQSYPAMLSGGMRQRVALLRTVLFNASFLLLDEPFGALDALTRLSLQMWLLDLWQTFHSSVLFITHDVREAILLSDRIYVLSARPARVLRVVEVNLPRPRRQENLALAEAVQLEQELVALLMKEQGQ